MFFLDEFDDIKKTFLINLMLTKIQSDEDIALTIIFSDNTTILLDGDMITHSQFKIFIDIQFDFTCNISIQSHFIELIRETQLIF